MAIINMLTAPVQCPHCNGNYLDYMQFCFGETWQHQYNIGDTLKWAPATHKWAEQLNTGDPNASEAIVHGLSHLDNCPICNTPFEAHYDIVVINNVLSSVRPVESYERFYEHEGDYYYP